MRSTSLGQGRVVLSMVMLVSLFAEDTQSSTMDVPRFEFTVVAVMEYG